MAHVLVDQCVSRRMVFPALAPFADVSFVSDVARGAPDPDVMELARAQGRILITEDFDFGALIFGERRPPPPGLIHLTLAGLDVGERDTKFAAEASLLIATAPGNFVIFSKGPMRVRPLPNV